MPPIYSIQLGRELENLLPSFLAGAGITDPWHVTRLIVPASREVRYQIRTPQNAPSPRFSFSIRHVNRAEQDNCFLLQARDHLEDQIEEKMMAGLMPERLSVLFEQWLHAWQKQLPGVSQGTGLENRRGQPATSAALDPLPSTPVAEEDAEETTSGDDSRNPEDAEADALLAQIAAQLGQGAAAT